MDKVCTKATFNAANGDQVGKLDWSSGELVFEGNAQESARAFFKYLKQFVDTYIQCTKPTPLSPEPSSEQPSGS